MIKQKISFLIKSLSKWIYNRVYIIILGIIVIKCILFVKLISTNNALFIPISGGFFSVVPYITLICYSMIVLSPVFLFKKRHQLWMMIIIDTLITLLLIGDILYYRGFSGLLNIFMFTKPQNAQDFFKKSITLFRSIDIIFAADIVFLICYAIHDKKICTNCRRSISLFLLTIIVPVLYITYYHYKVDVFDRGFYGQTVFMQSWAPTQTLSNLGPIGYHMYDSYLYFKNSRSYHLTEEDKTSIKKWYSENSENLPDNKYAGMFKGKNLLIIQVESLENFVINKKIQGQEITPALNKLLKNGLYFNNYHENVYNGTSSDSDLLTNAGVYPIRIGTTFFRYPNNTYKNSLPNVLKDIGYSTTAMHCDIGLFWNWMYNLKSIGFENCIDASDFKSNGSIGLGLSDHDFLSQAYTMIEKEKQPFYTFMVTQTSHAPFDLPGKYRSLNLENEFDKTILGDYFQSIHYTDNEIGNFLKSLNNSGMLKNTVVVIYGDHTGVHKYYQEKVAAVKPAESWWKDDDMKIPLIIYNPSIAGETFDVQAGQIDVMPTLEYLMGIGKDKYERNALGKVLVNTKKNYTILEDLQMKGKYTPEEQKHANDGITLSDKMVRADYFKDDH